jgi:hypothetical protein
MAALVSQCIRSRWASVFCLAVVVLALLLPAGGFGIPLCQFRVLTHLPCLACGLTRSFIGMAHLDLGRAAFFHPVGVVLFPLFVLVAALLPASPRVREGAASWAESHPRLLNWIAGGVLALFVLNGFGRIIWLVTTAQPSPW